MTNIFGLFGVTDYDVARRMTFQEYHFRMRGYALRRLDNERDVYLEAFLVRIAQATDAKGENYLFETFEDFYDYNQRKKDLLGSEKPSEGVDKALLDRAKRIQALRAKGELNV